MKKIKFIGIDVSSKTLDICIKSDGIRKSMVIPNDQKHIKEFLSNNSNSKEELITALENTGRYNWALYEVFAETNLKVYVISPLHLKKSMGLVRGKNDKIDAVRIADFIEKNHQDITPWQTSSVSIQKLKILLTERNYRIKLKRQLTSQKRDYKRMSNIGLEGDLTSLNTEMIENINKQIKILECKIQELIECDPQLKQKDKIIQSVPGVGKVLSWYFLAKTNAFTSITDPRKMACYAGVVPFEHQSGSFIYRKPKVSVFADKLLKSLLHLGAMTAIRGKNDLREYYLRKVAEGKNKMSALNAVRNKIILRVFAVIKNQKFYENNLVVS